jgi:predicted nucleic acid-binding Zn ribbon protein
MAKNEGTIPLKETEEYKKAVDIIRRAEQEEEEDSYTICPDCKKKSVKAKWSGVACITDGCGYWFCY